jgi:hypothetical protein
MNKNQFIHNSLNPYYNKLKDILKNNNESLHNLHKLYRKTVTTMKTNTLSNSYREKVIKNFKNVGHNYLIRSYVKDKTNKIKTNKTKTNKIKTKYTPTKKNKTFKQTPRWR